MKLIKNFTNRKFGILGLGKSNLAAINFLKKNKAILCIHDDNYKIREQYKNLEWEYYKNWDWKKLRSVIISPGIKVQGQKAHECITLAKKFKIPVINEIELLMTQSIKSKIIGVTGTNGKSTLVSLISHIFNSNKIKNVVGGNIGVPACNLQDQGEFGFIILELSSYQLLTIPNLKLDYAIITNIDKDHLDYHETFTNYKKAKFSIVDFLKPNGKLILDKKQKLLKDVFIQQKKIDKEKYILIKNNNFIGIDFSNLMGEHNLSLINSAYEISRKLGIKKNDFINSVNSFKCLPHRMENIYSSNNLKIIDDSKSTNGFSASAALKTFENIIWIAGGRAKTDGLKNTLNCLENVRYICLIGESKLYFKRQLKSKKIKIPIHEFENLKSAIDFIFTNMNKFIIKKITILFSPAAASFDSYKNFETRGKTFQKLVYDKLKLNGYIC